MKHLIIILALLSLVVSCGYVKERTDVKNCQFGLADVKVANISLKNIALDFKLDVKNPNTGKVVIERFDFKAYADKTMLAEGRSAQKKELAAGESTNVIISTETDFKNLRSGMKELILKGKGVEYTLMGTVYLSTFLGEIPYDFKINKKL
jgi:LEA14-like dessication related protein